MVRLFQPGSSGCFFESFVPSLREHRRAEECCQANCHSQGIITDGKRRYPSGVGKKRDQKCCDWSAANNGDRPG
jgi:hypothetical protein